MNKYDPHDAPSPDEWNSLDETERLIRIESFHREAGIKLPNQRIHAAIHAAVENQVALEGETPVGETIGRLITEGLDRHDAVHAVGGVLAEHLHGLMTGQGTAAFQEKEYFEELRQLTAARWRASVQ